MPTMNDLHDREADAVHDGHATERERLTELLHGVGPLRVLSRVRSIWRFMAELALIAAAAVGGALIGAHYHFWFGDHSMLGMGGVMANLANSVGLGMFLLRSSRTGSRVLGGVVARVPVMLLCFVVQLTALSCVCDDVSHEVYLPAITLK